MSIGLPNTKFSFNEIRKAFPTFIRFIYKVDKWRFFGILLDGLIRGFLSWALVHVLNQLTTVVATGNKDEIFTWTILAVLIGGALSLLLSINLIIRDILRHKIELELSRINMEKMMKVQLATLESPQFQALAHLFKEQKSYMIDLISAFYGIIYEGLEVIGLLIGVLVFPLPVLLVIVISLVIKFLLGSQVGVSSWTLFDIHSRSGRRARYYGSVFEQVPTAMEARLFSFAEPFYKRWSKHVESLLVGKVQVTLRTVIALGVGDFIQIGGLLLGCYLILSSTTAGAVLGILPFIVTYQRFQNVGSGFFGDSLWFLECAPFLMVFKAFQEVDETPDNQGNKVATKKETIEICFKDVWFQYPGAKEFALKGVNFRFREGEKLALVGGNGAGKSTLLKLMLGLYMPSKGQILVDGQDISSISLSDWRKILSVMFQHVCLYDDVLKEQVYYGDMNSKFDNKRFQAALKVSGVATFLNELPAGVDTHVGKDFALPEDNPVELSGGQRQMLAIARTLYRQSRFYIFDEPTSAVDAEKEEHFFEALPATVGDAGLLFISHRFSTLRRAERILVMQNGKIIEDDSHENLMSKKGRYAELFKIQAKMYQ